MKHYYISDPNSEKGFVEVNEEEFLAFAGTEEIRPYIGKVYRGELLINDVPEDLREQVQASVDARIDRLGEYKTQEISANELKTMIEEAI